MHPHSRQILQSRGICYSKILTVILVIVEFLFLFRLAGRFHLHTQSRGVGEERFLTIRQKYETTKLLKFLAKNGGSNSKFELIDDSGTSHQV